MALRARDVLIAAFIAFVAWGYLISWAPFLRFLGYAFVAGASTTLLAIGALVLLSTRKKRHVGRLARRPPRTAAFVPPEAWKEETEWLSTKAIHRRTPLYPPSFMISDSLDGLLERILRDYVTSWYSKISPSPNFVNEIERAMRTALINISNRLFGIDVVEVAVSRIVPLITAHLKEFYEAERIVRGKNLNRNITESEELDIAIAGKYRDGKLHPAASLAYSDLKLVQQEYLRRIIARLLPDVLPEAMIKSRAVSVLIKEIVSCSVFAPLMQMISDPDTWNQLMEAYGRTMLQDRKTVRKLRAALDQHASPAPKNPKPHTFPRIAPGDDERKFERFIRSIRQCNNLSEARRFRSEVASQLKRESMMEGQDQIFLRRLDTGKQLLDQRVGKLSAVGGTSGSRMQQSDLQKGQSTSRLLNASLTEVLHDASGLSYFMEYMDRHRLMTFVQFWIVVDGVRNPLEDDVPGDDPFSGTQVQWTDSDRTDIAQINEAYLSKPELNIPESTRDAVRAFLKAGAGATMPEYLRARSAVLKAQAGVLEDMKEVHFPNFKKSDLYYKFLTSDDASAKSSSRPARALKQPSVAPILESPSRPTSLSRKATRFNANGLDLRRNANSSNDLKSIVKQATDDAQPVLSRRSFDVDTSGPLFDDDIDDEPLARSTRSLDNESLNGESGSGNQEQMVEAMEAALNNIMIDDPKEDDSKDLIFDSPEPSVLSTKTVDSPRSSGEHKPMDTTFHGKERERPNLASLGLVNTSSRIGVFTDNDLFGDEDKFLEDEQTDPEVSADEAVEEEIHQAAPGDLGLAEAISALTVDIERLAAQDSVVDTLTRKAELTNNIAELRILGKSKSSLQREIRRKELQRQQYIVQESDNSLYGRANVDIKSIMVGKEDDGQEFALYVIEVQRKAGENMSAASWAVARRYSEFHDLHQRLRNIYPAIRHLEFPRRRLVMKLQREFLHKRRVSLENYLRELLRLPAVCRSRDLRAFLSQSAIVSSTKDSSREGERRDIISRIYNSVTDGMDEFLGNVPVLDQLSIAGQNLISAATSQFNTMQPTGSSAPLPIAPEDPIQTAEARAELLAFDPNASNTNRADQLEPFVKPICDIFLESFDLQRGNNWLRGRAVVVVLHQLLGGTVERKVREIARSMFAEPNVLKYIDMLKDSIWPNGEMRKETTARTDAQKTHTRVEASVMLATLIPDLAGNVVGKANAQAASRRIFATVNNQRLNAHLAFTILDEVIDVLFPKEGIRSFIVSRKLGPNIISSDGWASATKGGKPLSVLIIGGSLAGLLHGTMIKRLGHNVRIIEQNLVSMRTDHAAGMGTGPQGHQLLQILDSYKEPYGIPCPGFQFINRQSNVTRLVDTPMNLSGWNVLYYHLRANFDGFKSECCPEPSTAMDADGDATYELGKKATNVSYADNKATVEFEDLVNGGIGSAQPDLVIVADGANSTIRQKLLPGIKHKYSGYVAWRGTVPETDVSEDTVKLLEKRFTVYPMKQEYILGYIMPGGEGSLHPGSRLLNWVWYSNCPSGSPSLEQNMTDTSGHRHRNTLPVGKMRPEVWAKQKAHAAHVLEPSFLELITKTTEPFISTVRDCASPRATFFHGRLVLVGEALTLMRPHTGMSFSHAAVSCLLLQKVLRGEISMAEWEREVLTYAEKTRLQSLVLGEYFQSGVLSRAFLLGLISWGFALVREWLVRVFRRFHL